MPEYANDRTCIHDLAYLYANAVDQRDYPLFECIITEDAIIHGPGFSFKGIDEVMEGMKAVEQYKRTFHAVHNQIVTIEEEAAEGEVYCVASHLYDDEAGKERKLDWGIRYLDKYHRTPAGWRLINRELKLDWTQDLPTQG